MEKDNLNASRRPRKTAAVRYSSLLIVAEIALLAASLWSATQHWFLDHDAYPRLKTLGYGSSAKGMNCEILVYGDSTAIAAFDSSVIESKTGLKTCNISEIRPAEEVVGIFYPLDRYLSQNRPPRFLLAGWTPSNFDLSHKKMNFYSPEGYIYALQYDRGAWLWKAMFQHPKDSLTFLSWVSSSLIKDTYNRIVDPKSQSSQVDNGALRTRQAGFWTFDTPTQTTCAKDQYLYPASTPERNAAAVDAFRKRYQTNGTRVLVYATPIAVCDPDKDKDLRLVKAIVDNQLEILPVSNFNFEGIHLTAAGAERFSNEVAERVLQLAHAPEAY